MAAAGGSLRQLPNAVTALRIAAVPLLAVLALGGRREAFAVLFVSALLTDGLDGYLARRLDSTSALGALLDSVADLMLFSVAVLGVACLHPDVLQRHAVSGGLLLACWLGEPLVALARYGRISSFHTYAAKVAAYLLGFMVSWLFVFGYSDVLFYAAVAAGIAASIEEFLLIAILPEWRANVRGLYWVLRDGREVLA